MELICYYALLLVGYVREALLSLQLAGKLWSVNDNDKDNNNNDGKDAPSVNKDEDDVGRKIVKHLSRHSNDLVIAVILLTGTIMTKTPDIIALATIAITAVDIVTEKPYDDNNNCDAIAALRVIDAASKGMCSMHDELSGALFTIRV